VRLQSVKTNSNMILQCLAEGLEFRCLNYLTKQTALRTQNGKIEIKMNCRLYFDHDRSLLWTSPRWILETEDIYGPPLSCSSDNSGPLLVLDEVVIRV